MESFQLVDLKVLQTKGTSKCFILAQVSRWMEKELKILAILINSKPKDHVNVVEASTMALDVTVFLVWAMFSFRDCDFHR